jgi:hypothetical protein
MTLLCLKCASRNCTCGRLALARLVQELRGEEVVGATAEPLLGLIDGCAEDADHIAALEGPFVLKFHNGVDVRERAPAE